MSDELDGDPEKAIIQCFERSGDLSLLYLQETDKMRQNIPTYQAYIEGSQVRKLLYMLLCALWRSVWGGVFWV